MLTTNALMAPRIVSRKEWVDARKEHLRKEKEFTRLRDELSRERRALPWEKIEKPYVLLLGAYNFLDLVPKGRDEGGLGFSMEWIRHHDRYDKDHA